jgi:dolichol-phosphate mannosyltransferase
MASLPTPVTRSKLLVTLATYNERDNVAPLIAEIRKFVPQADILVIDDNSPDGTGQLVDELRASDPTIHVLHRPGKLGLGTATLDAMKFAMEHGYDLMQNMDADFSHPPRFLPAILAGMDKHDIMIGSRYAKGGGTENWPLVRLVISRTVNTLVRFFFRMPIVDASGAYRCYRVSTLRTAHLERTQSRGYSFQQEVLFRCHLVGARLGESPIIFENRRAGKSKVNMKEAVRSMATILWLGVTHFFGLEDYKRS